MTLEEAYALMRDDGREMYQGRGGGWFLTYGGGGPFTDAQVQSLQQMPSIVPRYKADGRLHFDCFAYGKTIDLDETVRQRRAGTIQKRECVYVDGTTGYPRT